MIFHLVMSIEGLEEKLSSIKSERIRDVYTLNAWGVPYVELRASLDAMKARGMKFIPGEDCKHRRKDGSCGCGEYAERRKKKLKSKVCKK